MNLMKAELNVNGAIKSGKLRSVTEVSLIYMVAISSFWMFDYIPGLEAIQQMLFGNSIFSTLFAFIALPALVIWLGRQNQKESESYLSMNSLHYALKTGGRSLNVMMPLVFLSFPFVDWLGYSFYGWSGGAIISGWHIIALPVLALIMRQFNRPAADQLSMRDLKIVALIVAISLILIYGLTFLHQKAADLLIAWVFIGFAEELFFRGYVQGRLNSTFGKPFAFLGINYGYGLLVAALLFGLAHILTPGTPFQWPWAIWTFFGGLCYGLIREKGGGFLAPAFVHAITMSFYVFFGS